MADCKTYCDSDCPAGDKDASHSCANPRLGGLSYFVGITNFLESRCLGLAGLILLSFKHVRSLVEQAQYHQDAQAPNVGQQGYRDIGPELHATFRSWSLVIVPRQLRHRHLWQSA